MYSFPNLEPVCCSMSGCNCCFLTCIQISQEAGRWSGIPTSWRIFQFVVIHIVNEAEVDVFLELPCFLYGPMNVANLISGSSVFSKSNLYIWNSSVHVLLMVSLRILSISLLAWVQLCGSLNIFGTALLWGWNENWPFPSSNSKNQCVWNNKT